MPSPFVIKGPPSVSYSRLNQRVDFPWKEVAFTVALLVFAFFTLNQVFQTRECEFKSFENIGLFITKYSYHIGLKFFIGVWILVTFSAKNTLLPTIRSYQFYPV